MDEFRFIEPDDSSERSRQLKNKARLQQAVESIGEHFTGILLIAYETLPNGVSHRYIQITGDLMAARYVARRWIEQEELIENQRLILNWIKQHGESNEGGAPV